MPFRLVGEGDLKSLQWEVWGNRYRSSNIDSCFHQQRISFKNDSS
jgi:hypothetical protein